MSDQPAAADRAEVIAARREQITADRAEQDTAALSSALSTAVDTYNEAVKQGATAELAVQLASNVHLRELSRSARRPRVG